MTRNAEMPHGARAAFPQDSAAGGRRSTTVPQNAVRGTPGWPPVRIPGRPGWWRHYINGQQVDLPHRAPPQQGGPHGK